MPFLLLSLMMIFLIFSYWSALLLMRYTRFVVSRGGHRTVKAKLCEYLEEVGMGLLSSIASASQGGVIGVSGDDVGGDFKGSQVVLVCQVGAPE